jgi:hypothetical protein
MFALALLYTPVRYSGNYMHYLLTQFLFMFLVIIKINSDYFLKMLSPLVRFYEDEIFPFG